MALSWLLAAAMVAATPTDRQVRELFAAARAGDVETVRALVESGVPAGAEHTWGMTALSVAAEHGRAKGIESGLEMTLHSVGLLSGFARDVGVACETASLRPWIRYGGVPF